MFSVPGPRDRPEVSVTQNICRRSGGSAATLERDRTAGRLCRGRPHGLQSTLRPSLAASRRKDIGIVHLAATPAAGLMPDTVVLDSNVSQKRLVVLVGVVLILPRPGSLRVQFPQGIPGAWHQRCSLCLLGDPRRSSI
jgi:hypothetical protein